MRRGGMHQAGTGLGGDVLAADDGDIAVLERVLEQHLVEAWPGRNQRPCLQAVRLRAASASSRTRIRAPFSVSIRS